MVEKEFGAYKENLSEINEFIFDNISGECSVKDRMQLEVAVEEIFVNIVRYAFADVNSLIADFKGVAVTDEKSSKNKVSISVDNVGDEAVIVFKDAGIRYNPLKKEAPDIELDATDRPIGGLGIFITRKFVDDMSYSYADGKNVLTLKKKLTK